MRIASIHISEIALKKVLEDELEIKLTDAQVNLILLNARKYSLSHRKLLVSTEKQVKQADNIKKSSLNYNLLLAKTIYMVRKSLKHRGIEIAKPGSRDFTLIKTITKNAVEFKDLFYKDDVPSVAFKSYITLANSKMKKFNLQKLVSIHSSILDEYEAIRDLNRDEFPEYTERAYRAYNKRIIHSVGMVLNEYKNIPDKFKFFMEVASRCKELKIDPETYIDAQFEGLAWASAIPDPAQLVGDKADERLSKYLFQNQIQLKDVDKEAKDAKISKLKDILKKK